MNEFTNNDLIMGGGFPHLFAVFDFGVLKHSGSLPKHILRHWFSFYDGRFAREPQFAFLMYNQLQRHSLTHQVVRSIRTDKDASVSKLKQMFENI